MKDIESPREGTSNWPQKSECMPSNVCSERLSDDLGITCSVDFPAVHLVHNVDISVSLSQILVTMFWATIRLIPWMPVWAIPPCQSWRVETQVTSSDCCGFLLMSKIYRPPHRVPVAIILVLDNILRNHLSNNIESPPSIISDTDRREYSRSGTCSTFLNLQFWVLPKDIYLHVDIFNPSN